MYQHKSDKARDECGVIAILSPNNDAARMAYFGLYALQHRGQESAGLALSHNRKIHEHKSLGLVSQVFTEAILKNLPGCLAIGHNRYSTSGSSSLKNAQPFVVDTRYGPLAMAHNGNIINAASLRRELLEKGVGLSNSSDSGAMIMSLAGAIGDNWPQRLKNCMSHWHGAYSITILTADLIMVARDPWGFRPLSVGYLADGGMAAASESGALNTLGCKDIREVRPGEIVSFSKQGMSSCQALVPAKKLARCTFESIYFSRPDSVWDGLNVHRVRQRLGAELYRESALLADVVIPVPDSSVPAAIGFAEASGIPYCDGFIKNRYIGRTFIEPTDALRRQGVAMKFNVLTENVRHKRVIMVDDSIVRGNTSVALIKLLKAAGATEVHMAISCPPITHPCFMGVDMGTHDELIAHTMNNEAMRLHFGADSLHFLSLSGMMNAIGKSSGYCNACFTGNYPIALDNHLKNTG